MHRSHAAAAAALFAVLAAAPCRAGAQQAPPDKDEALHRDFFQTADTHFTMLFEGPQDYQLASRALSVLENAYFRIGTTLNAFPDDLITVVLYTEEQFRDITRAPAWAAGAYDGKIRVPIRGALEHQQELERVLSHELAHAFVRAIAPRGVPTWLNEGIAVFFEPDGSARATRQLAANQKRLPFTRLARQFASLSDADAGLAYAQSAAITRQLFDEGGGWTVQLFLRDLADGVPFPEAYERRFLLPYEQFPGPLEPGH